MGDVDISFGGRGGSNGAGGRAVALPRSVDISESLSGTRRPVEATDEHGALAASLSNGGGSSGRVVRGVCGLRK